MFVTKRKYKKLKAKYRGALEDLNAQEQDIEELERAVNQARERARYWERTVRGMTQRMEIIRGLATPPDTEYFGPGTSVRAQGLIVNLLEKEEAEADAAHEQVPLPEDVRAFLDRLIGDMNFETADIDTGDDERRDAEANTPPEFDLSADKFKPCKPDCNLCLEVAKDLGLEIKEEPTTSVRKPITDAEY